MPAARVIDYIASTRQNSRTSVDVGEHRFPGTARMHSIRLRKPWQRTIAGVTESVEVPDETPESPSAPSVEAAAEVRYSRKFNTPTGLLPQTRVHLRISGWQGRCSVLMVNGRAFPVDEVVAPCQFDVTDVLSLHNEVAIVLTEFQKTHPRLCGEVVLLIEQVA